jgi:hypothetical protein
MNLRHFRTIHPDLIPGLVNTALRDDHEDLDDLCATHDLDRAEVEARLRELGYHYVAEIRQFRTGGTGEG